MTTTILVRRIRARASWIDQNVLPLPAAIAAGVFLMFALVGALGRISSHQAPARAIPTPALPIIMIATAQPAPAPIVPSPAAVVNVVTGPTLPRAVIAWSAPEGGEPIGALDAGRPYQVLARWGSEWIQADVAGSGAVWIKTNELLDTSAVIDLQPPPTPVPPPPAPPAPAPVVVIQQAAPTPAPMVEPEPAAPVLSERQRNIQDRLRGNEAQSR